MPAQKMPQKVEFKTSDGFRIVGNLLSGGKKAILLMHQYRLDKSSFNTFAKKLNDKNLTVLAIDLRGHGESVDQNGKKRGYATFKESDFVNMALDALGAKQFIEKEGFELYGVVGSSIGANTALNLAATEKSVEKVVLLSAGLDYFGIEIEKSATKVAAKVLIVASTEDEYSFASSKVLKDIIPKCEMIVLSGAGHGTWMFESTNLQDELLEWLSK